MLSIRNTTKILCKQGLVLLLLMGWSSMGMAQSDSVVVTKKGDTIKIGGIIVLKESDPSGKKRVIVTVREPSSVKKDRVTTSYFFFDLGFSNWIDKTNYGTATANHSLVNRPTTSDLGKKDFNLRTGKSVNFDLWLIGQKMNLIGQNVNLKYALGLQLNNYRFDQDISFSDGGLDPYDPATDIDHAFVFRDSIHLNKNKLAADYFTFPIMLNFDTKPNGDMGLKFSAGVSIGYLYSSRNKQVSAERGKEKDHGNFDIRKWKFSYVADLSAFNLVHLYGSYTPKSIFKNDLNFRPYTVGVRYSPKW